MLKTVLLLAVLLSGLLLLTACSPWGGYGYWHHHHSYGHYHGRGYSR